MTDYLWDQDPLPIQTKRKVVDATAFFPPCGWEDHWRMVRAGVTACKRCGQSFKAERPVPFRLVK